MLWLFKRNVIMEIESFVKQYKSEDKITERITIFETVRDFLYQINWANTPEKLLKLKEWYCASKHRLLKELYDSLWYQTQLCFVPFSFDMIYLPDTLKDWWYANKKWYHIFLQMMIDWKWTDIDATFNSELRDFYVVNENRDWVSSQKVICDYDKVFIPKSQGEEQDIKENLGDSEWFDENDKIWLKKYNKWIKSTTF